MNIQSEKLSDGSMVYDVVMILTEYGVAHKIRVNCVDYDHAERVLSELENAVGFEVIKLN